MLKVMGKKIVTCLSLFFGLSKPMIIVHHQLFKFTDVFKICYNHVKIDNMSSVTLPFNSMYVKRILKNLANVCGFCGPAYRGSTGFFV